VRALNQFLGASAHDERAGPGRPEEGALDIDGIDVQFGRQPLRQARASVQRRTRIKTFHGSEVVTVDCTCEMAPPRPRGYL
jgi:hypothetical protein